MNCQNVWMSLMIMLLRMEQEIVLVNFILLIILDTQVSFILHMKICIRKYLFE